MLKYLGFFFLLFFAISIPSLRIFSSGEIYDDVVEHDIPFSRWVGQYSLGNLQSRNQVVPFKATLQPSRNLGGYMMMECPKGSTIDELLHFGLAYSNHTVAGKGLDVSL